MIAKKSMRFSSVPVKVSFSLLRKKTMLKMGNGQGKAGKGDGAGAISLKFENPTQNELYGIAKKEEVELPTLRNEREESEVVVDDGGGELPSGSD